MMLFDENARVLRNIAVRGDDLSLPRKVEFAHIFQDRKAAEAFKTEASNGGFEASLEGRESDEAWDVIVCHHMIPTCERITAVEEHLDALARELGGKSDGWGFLSGTS